MIQPPPPPPPPPHPQVPPDHVTRERDGHDENPDQRPPRLNSEGGHKKRHASELYDAKGPGVMGGGSAGNGSGGGKGGRGGGSSSIMSVPAAASGPREGGNSMTDSS